MYTGWKYDAHWKPTYHMSGHNMVHGTESQNHTPTSYTYDHCTVVLPIALEEYDIP
jgi:hypothetical protein